MKYAVQFLLSLCAIILTSCASGHHLSPVEREFLRVPDHFVGNLSHGDRRFFLRETVDRGDNSIVNGRNINFRYDGEQRIRGEGPLTFHLFSSSAVLTSGIFIERFYDSATHIPPATSLYILASHGNQWRDITRQVLPEPFDPRLCYEFSPSSDRLSVRAYTRSPQGYVIPGRTLRIWRWTAGRFVATQK
jgi:hypothetical protein